MCTIPSSCCLWSFPVLKHRTKRELHGTYMGRNAIYLMSVLVYQYNCCQGLRETTITYMLYK
jgi:hypothetical protein